MKTFKSMILTVVIILSCFTGMVRAGITYAYIVPEFPTVSDDITIFVEGIESSGPVNIYDSEFNRIDNNIDYNLYLTAGFLTVISPWEYSENIGSLSPGTYDLNVNLYVTSLPEYSHTYSFSFEVVPEPTSLVFLTIGYAYLLRRKSKI
jgi:hypothetical protein